MPTTVPSARSDAVGAPDPQPQTPDPHEAAAALVAATTTFAEAARTTVRNTPAPLFRLLILASLLAAPVRHTTAIRAALALRPYTRSPATLAHTSQGTVARALTTAGYWRFYETKAALLIQAANDVVDRLDGDLRTLYDAAQDATDLHRRLRQIPGIGVHGAHIVLREVQGVWPDLQPYLDERVRTGAELLGLPTQPQHLAALVTPPDLPRLAAGCVRATLS